MSVHYELFVISSDEQFPNRWSNKCGADQLNELNHSHLILLIDMLLHDPCLYEHE